MAIPAGTYSLSITGSGDHNPFRPKIIQLDDKVCQTVGSEQQAMRLNMPFFRLGADGSQQLCTFDAEATIPGVMRVVRKR